MAAKSIRLALLASLVAVSAAGCANARHETSGTNDGVKAKNYRSMSNRGDGYGDMRLGLDRYRGADPNTFRNADSLRDGLTRDTGMTSYNHDGVNRWSDYRGATPDMTVHPSSEGVQSAKEVADSLTGLGPVQMANVLLAGNNAYVAVMTHNGQDIDNAADVKSQIAEKVKAGRPDIQNVYVSANPDFVNSVKRYTEDLNAGKPISGLGEEFMTMVHRLFPTNAAKTGTGATR
ncbi:YhcN/YlaJ family sporulation lipoprotein [Paenibacillus hodogayensis]|uniref:YhcN/YlaJ family sporulation lipoprotein n=1 Tax=Paenibacillus hodogayensis TaxID=279208 RepID=A0ABV5VWG6_9BACL